MGVNQSGVNEARYFLKMNIEILKAHGLSYDHPGQITDLDSIIFDEKAFFRKFFGFFPKLGKRKMIINGKGDWGWKDPRNTITLPFWLKYFPDMKVIHIYRNGIDVVQSFYKRNIKLNKYSSYYSEVLNSKIEALKLWENYYTRSESYRSSLTDRFLDIKYELLTTGNEAEIKKLQNYIGRDVRDFLLKHARGSRANSTDLEKLKTNDQAFHDFATNSTLMKQLGYFK